jgi:hypothetical protein
MYLFALVMIVLNLAAVGVGVGIPFIRHPAGGTRPAQCLSSTTPGSIKGAAAPAPGTTVHYDFTTTGVPGSTQGIDVIKS